MVRFYCVSSLPLQVTAVPQHNRPKQHTLDLVDSILLQLGHEQQDVMSARRSLYADVPAIQNGRNPFGMPFDKIDLASQVELDRTKEGKAPQASPTDVKLCSKELHSWLAMCAA